MTFTAVVFFEPFELDFELTDLLIELVSKLLLFFGLSIPLRREDLRQTFDCLLFPLRHHIGMDTIVAGDLIDSPLSLDRFQSDLDLEFWGVRFSLPLSHKTPRPAAILHLNQLSSFWGVLYCVAFQEERKNRVNQFDRQESNASVNRIIEVLQRIFSVMVDFEVLGKNPAAKVSMLKETPRDRIMTYEEEARIAPRLNLPARRMLRLAVVIALNAGLRKSEILKLRKADLDFERELIIIRKAKTGNRYALMNSLVRQAIFWTVNLSALGPDDMVFGGVDWIKDTWPQVCKGKSL